MMSGIGFLSLSKGPPWPLSLSKGTSRPLSVSQVYLGFVRFTRETSRVKRTFPA
jgi:hypothetical protein